VADPLGHIPEPGTSADAPMKSTIAALWNRVIATIAHEITVLVTLIKPSHETDTNYQDTSFIMRHKLSFADGLWWKAFKIAVLENPSLKAHIFLGAHEHVYACILANRKQKQGVRFTKKWTHLLQ
jgi:hypothetical protein